MFQRKNLSINFSKFLPLIFSVTTSIYICIQVYSDKYSPMLIYWWMTSIVYLLLSVFDEITTWVKRIKINMNVFRIIFIVLLPSLTRVVNYNLTRIHTDDLITAYFSATEKFSGINFFGGIPTDKVQWVSQFPTPFFALQKFSL